jgi:hypothetical protein
MNEPKRSWIKPEVTRITLTDEQIATLFPDAKRKPAELGSEQPRRRSAA